MIYATDELRDDTRIDHQDIPFSKSDQWPDPAADKKPSSSLPIFLNFF